MIKGLKIRNFKCFQEVDLSFTSVNMLTGINGMGKSTIIQSLLLLWQSYQRDPSLRNIYLNEQYVSIGYPVDAISERAESDQIEFSFETEDNHVLRLDLHYQMDSDIMPVLSDVSEETLKKIMSGRFTYLSAYRIRPQENYGIVSEEQLQKGYLGNNGEYAIQYLFLNHGYSITNEKICIDKNVGKSLGEQTRYWMDKIAPGVLPKVKVDAVMRKAEVRYEFMEGNMTTNPYRSENVGFGITYVLPVIVALLSAKEGDTVIIENPEAHIHPAGQRILGELIALTGQSGVQIFVETHSDHIMNGIRVLVKNKIIENDSSKFFFFYKDEGDDYKHKYVSPEIQEDGRLDIWPEGFFDEWDKVAFDLF